MNFHSDEWIMDRVKEHYEEALTLFPEDRIVGIFYQGSGNYGLDTAISDVDTKLVVLPPIEDIIFEVDNKSLTNRPDLWGHYGMAREFAALTDQPLKPLPIIENPYKGDSTVSIEIRNPELAYRYTGVRVENVTKNVSPMDMQIRLFYCGTRAINLLADLTNYLMLELGQPMHAFDGNKISNIVVDTPKENIKFTTLDGQERDITTDTLLIYDNDTPVAIAGIMGGLDSEIVDNTNSVVFESANFDAVCVRKSASRMALRTDASARYEKTLDPEMTMLAIKRLLKLLIDIDPSCEVVSQITDVYVKHYPEITINFDKKFVDRYTGIDISNERIKKTLISLGFETEMNGDDFTTKVPSFRATKDVSMKADIIEEITRIYGYDNFEIKTTLSPLIPAQTTTRRKEENYIKDLLVKTYAMNEVHTRVWQNPDELRSIGLTPEDNIKILGSAEEQANGILRTTMFESFLPLVYKNRNYKPSFGFFEIGRICDGTLEDGSANERRMLAVAMYSKEESEKTMYMSAVQLINTFVSHLKHKAVSYAKITPEHVWQHPKNTASISIDDVKIGVLNTIHPKYLNKIVKSGSIICIEIDMDSLLAVNSDELMFDEPSKFPAIDYDLSLLIPEGVRFDALSDCWNSLKIDSLKSVSVIDIYDSGIIKSITVRFSFCLDDRTLTGEEVQKHIDDILGNLDKVNVKLKS